VALVGRRCAAIRSFQRKKLSRTSCSFGSNHSLVRSAMAVVGRSATAAHGPLADIECGTRPHLRAAGSDAARLLAAVWRRSTHPRPHRSL
jgi:hypothetical protein